MNRTSKKAALGGCAGSLTIAAALAASGLIWAGPARAALTLTISEPGAPGGPISTTVTDNGAGDNDSTPGSIEFNDPSFGDFKTNVLVGFSNKNDPTAGPEADLQIQSLDITKNTNASIASLIITLSDTGFTFPGNSGDNMLMSSSLAGTVTHSVAGSGDNVTFKSIANPSGATTPLETAVLPGNTGSVPLAFTATPVTSTVNFVRGASFDLSNVTTVTLSNGNEATNLSGTTTVISLGPAVPEPTTAALIGLIGLPAIFRRSRRRGH
jgi:hypothetical protein